MAKVTKMGAPPISDPMWSEGVTSSTPGGPPRETIEVAAVTPRPEPPREPDTKSQAK
jgi:hypothetical protein